MLKLLLATASSFVILLPNQTYAKEPIKIGVLATLKGAYTVLGEDTVRGAQAALDHHGKTIGENTVELVIETVDTTSESAVRAATNLLEKKVHIIVGPLSSAQGKAIKDFSKTKVQATFINGISGAVETTIVSPSETFFRFNTDNAQWSAGLGDYVYNQKAYKKIEVVADDYPFNYAQLFGFEAEYCAAGGEISNRHWIELGEKDYTDAISSIKQDVEAIYLGLSGTDAIRFAKQYKASGGTAKFIGSSITVDGALLSAPEELKSLFVGMPSSGPQADTWGDKNWQDYVKAYKDSFPPEQRFLGPSILATGYYNATSAALMCLQKIEGDFSNGHDNYRQCLSTLTLDAPNGRVKLDENRQAIANNYISEVVKQPDGSLTKRLVGIRENVNQTLGLSKKAYDALGLPARDQDVCKKDSNKIFLFEVSKALHLSSCFAKLSCAFVILA